MTGEMHIVWGKGSSG